MVAGKSVPLLRKLRKLEGRAALAVQDKPVNLEKEEEFPTVSYIPFICFM